MAIPEYRAFFLVGPTAAGKTDVAQRLAVRRGAFILSADSMLVYRGMDIGTAKPTPAERGDVPYWGLDVVLPSESYNVSRFLTEASCCFAAATQADRPVIVVGGTGLYIKALLEGLDELPPPMPESRRKWQAVLEKEGVEGLRNALKGLRPDWFEVLADPFNSRRLVRALELIEAGCSEPPCFWRMGEKGAVITGLDYPREVLVRRIERRVQTMYKGGLLAEVNQLLAGGWNAGGTAAQAIGYAEAIRCLQGKIQQNEAMAQTSQRTRQLAKRQMTWFRHQVNVSWIPLTDDLSVDDVADRVSADWDKHGPQLIRLTA